MNCYTYIFIGSVFVGYVIAIPKQQIKSIDFTRLVAENFIDVESSINTDFASCSEDPENDMTPVEIIRRNGYRAEEHFVTTKDGYILGLHRIPGPKGSRAVLMNHGLIDSSMAWIINGKNRSLGYILANKGYDVWLGNFRGNTYSKKHVQFSPSGRAFWNFSWQEMGTYDLPAVIEYITALKNDTLFYIGHSMGTTAYFVMGNERPDIAAKVRAMISLGPAARLDNLKGLLTLTKLIFYDLQNITNGHYELYPQNPIFSWVGKCICNRPGLRELCRDIFFAIVGYNEKNFDLSLLPLIITHAPAGTSLKSLFHFNQISVDKRFQKYNYGPKKNLRIYNSTQPPVYELEKVQTPVALFYGANDFLTTPEDVEAVYDQFPNKIGLYKMEDPNFNHMDFIWGHEAPKIVNPKIISILEKY